MLQGDSFIQETDRPWSEGRKVNHNNLSSEPHSPNFLVRAKKYSYQQWLNISKKYVEKLRRMWLGRDIVVVALPPLVKYSRRNLATRGVFL